MDLDQQYAENQQGMLAQQASTGRDQEIASRISLQAQAMGLNASQMEALIQEAATQYGADAADVQSIRQLLGLGGTLMMAGGMGLT